MKPNNILITIIASISLICASGHIGNAQIVLNSSDLPVDGNLQISVRTNPVQGESISPGMAGPNVKWDFRDLKPCCGTLAGSTDTITWVTHYSTGNPGFFPLSNLATKDRCFTFHSHISHVDETKCYFTHYIKNSTGLWRYGQEEPSNYLFNSNWNVFPLLIYGESLDTSAEIHIPLSDDSVRVYHIQNRSVADGWGVISTPDTTAEVIRVYTTETVYDSLYVKGNLTSSMVYPDNYYYRWYTKNLGFPVLEITKGLQTQLPPFRQEARFSYHENNALSAPFIEVSEKVKVYPNPFTNVINLEFGDGNRTADFFLFDATGKICLVKPNLQSKSSIQIDDLLPGMYFL